LENPARVSDGRYDSNQIGPWTLWQGNLDAEIMIVGQDWGDVRYFTTNLGHEAARNPTNEMLVKLLTSIGIAIAPPSPQNNGGGVLFLTNAILCLKQNGLQAPVQPEWFQNCGRHFLKPTIDLVQPKILITLGESAYRMIRDLYGLPKMTFRDAVAKSFRISEKMKYFPMYHCGQRILHTHRHLEQQLRDWARVKPPFNAA
jgi:DNA polymerase